jgi:LacI family transcriptional regulator
LELGLEHVAFFGHWVENEAARDGMVRRLEKQFKPHNIRVRAIEWRGESPSDDPTIVLLPSGTLELQSKLKALPRPMGVFCEDDHMARLFCVAAKAANLWIPRDFAVLGAGNSLVGQFGNPSLSTVIFPGAKVGLAAFEEVESRLLGGAPCFLRIHASRLVIRESTGGHQRDIAMERVFRQIERHALQGLTVQELQGLANTTTKALRRRYLAAYAEEPGGHIRRLRLKGAIRRLEAGTDSVSDIAAECGFSSQSAFCNYFLRHMGSSPLEFRKTHRKAKT